MKLILLLVGLLSAFGWFAEGATKVTISNPEDLAKLDLSESINMRQYFSQIDATLMEKLPQNDDLEANLKAAKEMRKGIGIFDFKQRPLRKALKLFISLSKTVDKCNYRSYKILAKNKVAADDINQGGKQERRVRQIVDKYRQRHAEKCRPYYRKEYKTRLSEMPKRYLKRIATVLQDVQPKHVFDMKDADGKARTRLDDLPIPILIIKEAQLKFKRPDEDFNWDSDDDQWNHDDWEAITDSEDDDDDDNEAEDERYDYAEAILSEFTGIHNAKKEAALSSESIAPIMTDRVVEMLKEDKKIASIRRTFRKYNSLRTLPDMWQVAFNYVIKPCREYVRVSEHVLAPARFDAAIEDDQQFAYLTEDENFAKAIANFRICKLLMNNSPLAMKDVSVMLNGHFSYGDDDW